MVRIEGRRVTAAVLGPSQGLAPGDRVALDPEGYRAVLGAPLLGRAVDGLGVPLDGREPPAGLRVPVRSAAPRLEGRRLGAAPLWTGVRAIDGLLVPARGARIGIFGPPGTGKSVLLGAIAAGVDADAVVVALVGERGGEALRLAAAVDRRTTLVCAPADRSAGERLAAGDLALAQAERLRGCGLDVVVIFDSLARYAGAARELAVASGEPLGRGGYPASAFARLAALVERAGCTEAGSLTLIATVLTDAGDPSDPLGEAARSFLDGHLVLDRGLAERGAFPAIDVVRSLSRTMAAVVEPRQAAAAARVRTALARLEATAEARELGLAVPDGELARAVAAQEGLEGFLRQTGGPVPTAQTLRSLEALADML